jgi:hypothetical protein
MAMTDRRRGDRISLALKIQVTGKDRAGQVFTDKTQTQEINRHGAKIPLRRILDPGQELLIHHLGSGREAKGRVVGQVGESSEGRLYGVESQEAGANLWGIDFPPVGESRMAAGRVLLECMSCRAKEFAFLNELELEVFHTNQRLSRNCKSCSETTIWIQSPKEPQPGQARKLEMAVSESPPPPTPRTRNERMWPRLAVKVPCGIRTPLYGEDVTITENVSRGGLCFKSETFYSEGSMIEVAVPYAQGGANIFAPARVVWARELPSEKVYIHGVSYFQPR